MKGGIKVILTVLATLIVVLGIQAGLLLGLGKERLASIPAIGNMLFVIEGSEEIVEIDDSRFEEVDHIITDLKSKVAEINTLLQASKDKNTHLKREIDKQKAKINNLNTKLTQMLYIIETSRAGAIEDTAKTYENMTPETVAEVFKEMDSDEEVAELLTFMRDKQAGKIMVAYIEMSQDKDQRRENAKRIADITKIRQRMIKESDLEI